MFIGLIDSIAHSIKCAYSKIVCPISSHGSGKQSDSTVRNYVRKLNIFVKTDKISRKYPSHLFTRSRCLAMCRL